MKVIVKHDIDIIRELPHDYPDLTFAVRSNKRGLIAECNQVGLTAAGKNLENLLADIELVINNQVDGSQKQD